MILPQRDALKSGAFAKAEGAASSSAFLLFSPQVRVFALVFEVDGGKVRGKIAVVKGCESIFLDR
jgi:hypothetical protein